MTTTIRTHLWGTLIVTIIAPVALQAHHGFSSEYNADKEIEIAGVITSVTWKNPHVRLEVTVDAGKPGVNIWAIESNSVSNLSRMGITADHVSVGQAVKVAGNASRVSDHRLYMNHLLLPDGQEINFTRNAAPHWSGGQIRDLSALAGSVIEQDFNKRPSSIFAVWTTVTGSSTRRGILPKNSDEYPVTARARQQAASVDLLKSSPLDNCKPKGMPVAMDAPYPIEFVKDGNNIKLKLEEYDAVRLIRLNIKHDDKGIAPSSLGYSTGVWQGDQLVVTTTKVNYGFLVIESKPLPVIQGPHISLVETFKLSTDHNHLDYTLSVTDPDTLTKPMSFAKSWQYQPGAKLQPYDCTR